MTVPAFPAGPRSDVDDLVVVVDQDAESADIDQFLDTLDRIVDPSLRFEIVVDPNAEPADWDGTFTEFLLKLTDKKATSADASGGVERLPNVITRGCEGEA